MTLFTDSMVKKIKPYTDACALYCPFLNKELSYCTRYSDNLQVRIYVHNVFQEWYDVIKFGIKRWIHMGRSGGPKNGIAHLQAIYYEKIDDTQSRLYLRCEKCKKSYHTAELIGKIVT